MAINRFYQPAQGQYVSQFVPTELPAELMMKVLASKQAVQDAGMKQRQMLGDWYMNAFGVDDTAYVKSKQDEIRKWFDESANKEWASPEIQKGYQTLVRSINDDARLGRIQSVYDWNKEYEEAKKKLAEEGGHANAQEVYNEIDRRRARYAAPGSGGSEGEVQFLNMSPTKGVNIHSELLSMFTPLKADEWEAMRSIQSQLGNVYYNIGTGGISLDKINSVVDGDNDKIKGNAELILRSAAGQQLSKRFDMLHGFPDNEKIASMEIAKMSEEDQIEYLNKRARYVLDQAISIGQTVRQSTFKTGEAAARNTASGRELEQPSYRPVSVAVNSESLEDDYVSSSDNYNNNATVNKSAKEKLYLYNQFMNEYQTALKSNPTLTKDAFLESKRHLLGNTPYAEARIAINDPDYVANQTKLIEDSQLAMDEFNIRKDVAVAKAIGLDEDSALKSVQTINDIKSDKYNPANQVLTQMDDIINNTESFINLISGNTSVLISTNDPSKNIWMGKSSTKNANANLENWFDAHRTSFEQKYGKGLTNDMFDALRHKAKIKLASLSNEGDWLSNAINFKLGMPTKEDVQRFKKDLGVPENYESYQKDIETNFNNATGTQTNVGILAVDKDVKSVTLANGQQVRPVDRTVEDIVRDNKTFNTKDVIKIGGNLLANQVDWSTYVQGSMNERLNPDGTITVRGTVIPLVNILDKKSLSGTTKKEDIKPIEVVLKISSVSGSQLLEQRRQELIVPATQGNSAAMRYITNSYLPKDISTNVNKIIDGATNKRIVLDSGGDEVIVAFKPEGNSSMYYYQTVNKKDLNTLTIEESSMFNPSSKGYKPDVVKDYSIDKPENIIWRYMEQLKSNGRILYNPYNADEIPQAVLR